MAGSKDEWKLLYVVRGYHVYKYVWDLSQKLFNHRWMFFHGNITSMGCQREKKFPLSHCKYLHVSILILQGPIVTLQCLLIRKPFSPSSLPSLLNSNAFGGVPKASSGDECKYRHCALSVPFSHVISLDFFFVW